MDKCIKKKYKHYFNALIKFFQDKGYKVKPYPKVILNDTHQDDDVFGKTGYYDPETKTVVVFTNGRFFKDVLRSFSHELVHHMQNLDGRLGDDAYNGQEIIHDKKLIELEKEAYLLGNILMRSFTEEEQEKHKQ